MRAARVCRPCCACACNKRLTTRSLLWKMLLLSLCTALRCCSRDFGNITPALACVQPWHPVHATSIALCHCAARCAPLYIKQYDLQQNEGIEQPHYDWEHQFPGIKRCSVEHRQRRCGACCQTIIKGAQNPIHGAAAKRCQHVRWWLMGPRPHPTFTPQHAPSTWPPQAHRLHILAA